MPTFWQIVWNMFLVILALVGISFAGVVILACVKLAVAMST